MSPPWSLLIAVHAVAAAYSILFGAFQLLGRTKGGRLHRSFMRGSYFGVLGAFIGVVAVPDGRIPQMAVHDLPGLSLWLTSIILTATFTVLGVTLLGRKADKAAPEPSKRLWAAETCHHPV